MNDQQIEDTTYHHPFNELCQSLKKINDELNVINTKESFDNQWRHHRIYFDLFQSKIEKYFSGIPVSLGKCFFDQIRLNMIMNLKFYPTLSDYYFDLSLAYLTMDNTINYLNGTKSNFLSTDKHFLHLFLSISCNAVHSKTNESYSICVSHKNVPRFFQLNSSTEHLLQALINYCNNYFFNKQEQNDENTRSVLKWLVNMTKIHGFVPYFIKMNYAEVVLKWLKIERDQKIEMSLDSWYLILNLLHNLARHWMGVKALNKLKAIRILNEWKTIYLKDVSSGKHNESDKDILIVYYLLYAVLLEPKELKKEMISNLQHILDYILERTIQSFDSQDLCCGPYNVCEYLNGLAKFIVNDAFLLYTISRENIFNSFVEKFLYFNQNCHETDLNTVICALLYSIFWSISFHTEFNTRLKSINTFLSLVEERAKTECNDEHAIMMKRAAKGILFNLDLIQTDVQPIEEPVDIKYNNHQIQVMISYAHKDTTFCKKLVNNLQTRFTGEIWVDFNKLSHPYDDDWEEIAKAITQCDVILMIVTENYCSSKSCRREVIHADKRNKRMIPIYQGKDYKAEDWFEIRVGSATWIRFGDKKTDEEIFDILLGLIQKTKKHEQNEIENTICLQSTKSSHESSDPELSTSSNTNDECLLSGRSIDRSISLSKPSVDQWTREQVQQWMPDSFASLQLSSGRALIAYMNLLNDADAQRDEYENHLRSLDINRASFANLISSFDSLRSSHQFEPLPILTHQPDQWKRQQIQLWFEENHLSVPLFKTLQFQDGTHMMMYAKLLVCSSSRINEEYDRLRYRIGKDSFHLDEYVHFVHTLKVLYEKSQRSTDDNQTSCTIL